MSLLPLDCKQLPQLGFLGLGIRSPLLPRLWVSADYHNTSQDNTCPGLNPHHGLPRISTKQMQQLWLQDKVLRCSFYTSVAAAMLQPTLHLRL